MTLEKRGVISGLVHKYREVAEVKNRKHVKEVRGANPHGVYDSSLTYPGDRRIAGYSPYERDFKALYSDEEPDLNLREFISTYYRR